MSKPKVISYSLYPFVEQAIRDAGYEVFNTNRSSKLPILIKRFEGNCIVVPFGWSNECIEIIEEADIMMTLYRSVHFETAFFRRPFATQVLNSISINPAYKREYIYPGQFQNDVQLRIWREQVVPGWTDFRPDREYVFKIGDAHCGQDKLKVPYNSHMIPWNRMARDGAVIEEFIPGRSIRGLCIDGKTWCIETINDRNWIKNDNPEREVILDPKQDGQIMEDIESDLETITSTLNLKLFAVDYQVHSSGNIVVLELNVIPGIPDEPDIKAAYAKFFVDRVEEAAKTYLE